MTRIGPGVVVRGDLTTTEALQIDGAVHGRIEARGGQLILGSTSRIEADVDAIDVLVQGRVLGHIMASQRIALDATADVVGSLSANHVVLADGARFHGRIDMGQRTLAARVAAHRAAHGDA